MSFTTRCPACGTMFRVVADQLKISEGWVRCGHCADVFDATLYLQPWIPPGQTSTPEDFVEAAPEPAFEPPQDSPPVDHRDVSPVDEPAEPDWGGDGDEHAVDTRPPPVYTEAPASSGESDAEESNFQVELERFAAGLGRLSAARSGAVVSEEEVSVESTDMPQAPSPPGEVTGIEFADSVEPTSSELEPGFVRQARRRAFWQSPGMLMLLTLLALLLAAVLVAQWAVHERDRLAALRPDLKPWLERICEPLGCQLAPVRRIDAIVIDSTSLVRRLGNFHSFDLVLKNTASIPLAVPALELTLTDIGDAVISRRVFLPEEWPDAPALLPAQASVTVNFRLSLALGETTPMAGYRALVFYP